MRNNIKKIALSLLVVGLAIGAQSFKNAENKFSTVYYQTSEGYYTKTPPSGSFCNTSVNTNPCQIEFSNTLPDPDFTLPNIPAGGGTRTDHSQGLWQ